MSTTIVNNLLLTGSYQASQPVLIKGERITLDFEITVAGGGGAVAANVEWYLEFASDDPNASATKWFREVAEEDAAGGIVEMPLVVRNFAVNGGAALPAGATYYMTAQFVRTHQFARIQIRLQAGNATTVTVKSRIGLVATNAPV